MALLSKVGCGLQLRFQRGKQYYKEASKMKETCISFPSLPSYSTETMRSLHLDSAGVWYKRGQHAIVAANPPTEDAVIATEPLTKEDLVGYLASGLQA